MIIYSDNKISEKTWQDLLDYDKRMKKIRNSWVNEYIDPEKKDQYTFKTYGESTYFLKIANEQD